MKPKVWGGRKLEHFGKRLPADELIGESWELCDLPESIPDGRCAISGGPFDGRTLRDVIEHDAAALLGDVALSPEGGFPLLLKYLDANDNLSVQVHPDDAYVRRHPEARLKSEAWHILDAQPGSVIYAGLKPGVDRDSFAQAIEDGTVVDKLVAIPAVPGECHYLPSGTCHALGAGVLVAEVQTPSDTTFRVWDWGRTSRELHIGQALECIDFSGVSVCKPRPASMESDGITRTALVDVEHFRIEHMLLDDGTAFNFEVGHAPVAIMVLDGGSKLRTGDETMMLQKGRTMLLPAQREISQVLESNQLELLVITLQAC